MSPSTPIVADRAVHWRHLEQYATEVLCPVDEERPLVFATVYEAVAAARQLGGCALARCLHAPMRWVLVRPLSD